MAEQEVIKHTKKSITLWSNKEHSFWHKLKDFLLEIVIIVFAVTLSIWLHDRSEKKHQQADVKEFLLGLKDDLKNDTLEMQEDKKSYFRFADAFSYIVSLKMKDTASRDSIQKYFGSFFNTTGLVPNSGRFEGFKASGKIGTIENRVIQNDILDLYQENIPSLILSTNNYTDSKQRIIDYFNSQLRRITDSTTNVMELIKSDQARNIAGSLDNVKEIVNRYNDCIRKARKIILAIDEEYDL